jgi:hypothetical protein
MFIIEFIQRISKQEEHLSPKPDNSN